MIHKGGNKILYKSEGTGEFILSFDDEDAKLCAISNKISQIIFELLTEAGVPNHFLKAHGQKEQVIVALEMLPFICNIHTATTGDMANRLSCASGMKLKKNLLELKLKRPNVSGLRDHVNASKSDRKREGSIISSEHVLNFEWVTKDEWQKIHTISLRIMDVLYGFFRALDCTINSIALEFGRMYKNGTVHDILLADEMTPRNISFSINDMLEIEPKEMYIELAKRLGVLKYE